MFALPPLVSRAASISVVPEGDNVFRYELTLEPGEFVSSFMLDLVVGEANVEVFDAGFPVPVIVPGGGSTTRIVDAWTANRGVVPIPLGLRPFGAFDQAGNLNAGITDTQFLMPDVNDPTLMRTIPLTYLEFIDRELGSLSAFRDPSYVPGGLPIARLHVIEGPVPSEWVAGRCFPANELSTCELPEAGVVSDAPEPTLAGLLAVGLAAVAARKGVLPRISECPRRRSFV